MGPTANPRPVGPWRVVSVRDRTPTVTHRAICIWWSSLLLLAGGPSARAEPALNEPFDGPATAWQFAAKSNSADKPVRLVEHEVIDDPDRPEPRVERLVVDAAGGESVHFHYAVGHAPVLDELAAQISVRSNRPGVMLAARVVLPRAIDPESGEFRTILVYGTRYEMAPMWQQLRLSDIPTKARRQVRVLRLEANAAVDHREAFVDQLVLVVPGGTGGTEVRTDDLTLDGVLLAESKSTPLAADDTTANATPVRQTDVLQVGFEDPINAGPISPQGLPPRIQVRGSMLQIDGRPFFPRAISHHGESLDVLAELGFNTVLLQGLPTAEESKQAEKLQLWQLSPPPTAAQLAAAQLAAGQLPVGNVPAASSFRHVLGWYLDAEAAALPTGQLELWVDAVRRWDRELDRPILLAPNAATPDRQPLVDAMVLGRGVAGDRDALRRHVEWFQQQSILTGRGVPTLMRIQLTPDRQTQAQAAVFADIAGAGPLLAGIDDPQIGTLTRMAITGGCRGLLVESGQSLATKDTLTQRRANSLALENLRLHLLDPWLVGGKVIGTAVSSNPQLTAVVMQVEQARLVVPLDWSDTDRATATALTVPGVPESNRAFLLTLASLTPLDHKRVAGGIRVIIDPRTDGMVLLTEDPRVVSSLRAQVQRNGGRAAQLSRQVAAARLELAQRIVPPAAPNRPQNAAVVESLRRATGHLGQCDQQLAGGNATAAFLHATAAARLTSDALVRALAPPADRALLASLPLRPALDTLPAYAAMTQSLAAQPPGDNRLYGGDFEDLQRLVEFGWKHVDHADPSTHTHVELSTANPRHGTYNLSLSATPTDGERQPAALAEPPLWITSPVLTASAGELLEITGWVRVDEPIAAHADGLEIVDSLGGPEMAIRVQQTTGWQPFRMIRHVPTSDTGLQLTFVLHGLGRADIDAVMVRPLGNSPISLQPPVGQAPQAQAARPQPLFGNPQLR
jgi:hypothetical protein